ncbi:hypothetical protein OBBRIDRAFT_798441, partial [Obba rivulosa]
MVAVTPSAAQISVPDTQQTDIGIAVKAIQVNLDSKSQSRMKSVLSRRKSAISCTIGDDTEEKSFDANNRKDFQWDFEIVRKIPSGTPLKIGWKVDDDSDCSIDV